MALFEWVYKLWHKDNPIYKPLYDESVPFLDRLNQIANNKKTGTHAKVRQLKEKYGHDYVYLHPISKYVLYKDILRRRLKDSLACKGYLALRCRWWSFRLWHSKKFQSFSYNSPTKYRWYIYLYGIGVGSILGMFLADVNGIFTSPLVVQFNAMPRVHWMASYLLDTSMLKEVDEDFKKDSLAQGMERVLAEGIQLGKLDSLSWLMIGTYFSVKREDELSYLAFHMAHLVEHEKVGGNSLQPFDLEDAMKLFRQK